MRKDAVRDVEQAVRDVAQATALVTPFIAPGITDPTALIYKKQIEDRHRAQPTPNAVPIPLLTGEARSGMTMSDQAMQGRQPPQQPQGSIFESTPPQRPPAILPQDLLPDEATKDPAYREGGGSRYAASQPQLAYKYGVIRNGQRLVPQQLSTQKPGLKPETIEGIKAIEEANRKTVEELGRVREKAESPDQRIEAEAAAGTAGASARLAGAVPGPDREEVEKAIKKLDDFDFNRFREVMDKDIINNEDQRKLIEARLGPLSLDDMIMNNFVTQTVPIIPGKFEPEFQSLSGEDDLCLKRLIMTESKSLEVSERYFLDKFSLMSVAAGVRSVNRNPLPDFRDQNGDFNDKLFWVKFNRVLKFNFHMLGSLGINHFWFDVRVRKLFAAEKLGNG
jgi:hypothetical protein